MIVTYIHMDMVIFVQECGRGGKCAYKLTYTYAWKFKWECRRKRKIDWCQHNWQGYVMCTSIGSVTEVYPSSSPWPLLSKINNQTFFRLGVSCFLLNPASIQIFVTKPVRVKVTCDTQACSQLHFHGVMTRCLFIDTCIYAYTYTHTHKHRYVCLYLYTYSFSFHIYVYTCIYTYTHVQTSFHILWYMYTCIHTYTHVQTCVWNSLLALKLFVLESFFKIREYWLRFVNIGFFLRFFSFFLFLPFVCVYKALTWDSTAQRVCSPGAAGFNPPEFLSPCGLPVSCCLAMSVVWSLGGAHVVLSLGGAHVVLPRPGSS